MKINEINEILKKEITVNEPPKFIMANRESGSILLETFTNTGILFNFPCTYDTSNVIF